MSFNLIAFLITLLVLSWECVKAEVNEIHGSIPIITNHKAMIVDALSEPNYSVIIVGLPEDNQIFAFIHENMSKNPTPLWNQSLKTNLLEGDFEN